MNLETVPLLLVALLLLTAGGDVTRADVTFDGANEAGTDPLVVAGGTVTVPADTTTPGPVYVVNGTLDVQGRVGGDVVQLGGRVVAGPTARIDGTVDALAGRRTVDPAAQVAVTSLDVTAGPSPAARALLFLVQTGVLALAGYLVARRWPTPLATAARAARRHPVVSLTAGALVSVSAIAMLVFMAFTLVLIPVSVLGLVAAVLVAGYGVVALGYLLGTRLARVGLEGPRATAAGVALVSVAAELLSFVPLGDVVVLLGATVGIGAVLVTYLGFREFVPASIPE
ncbi:polymer-forming cytoskeletal protein [Salinirubellus salinus]|uniref:Polymer-forming cytoskeletal protein n=1 Tax=Salinirubellus salinus TaxID=1364945 RepID=A0A9E7R1U0_9EURY|nr:polymer-forming cytoskeletal protein [Salinirubellus salinus]UWM54041.1 polymer-forming cytoskeletal protein [Salinirubellus salinus]